MTDNDADEKYLTAVHEAGHAVMTWALGIEVFKVTIVSDGDRRGYCRRHWQEDELMLNYVIALAGPVAEAWFNDDQQYSWIDYRAIDKIVNKLIEIGEWPEDSADAFRSATQDFVEARMERLRPKVIMLARELMFRNTLTGDEIEELFSIESCDASVSENIAA